MTASTEQIQPGWDAYSSEGEQIGSIAEVGDGYLVVTKGLFMPKDHFVPLDAVTDVRSDQGQVILNCMKNEFDTMGWDQPPAQGTYETGGPLTSTATPGRHDEMWGKGETRKIPRYEEELRAEKASRETGEVRVTKDVTEEEQSFEVPVQRESVDVKRVAVNRPAGESEEAFADGETIRVPIRGEEVHVTKEPRVVEELEITKRTTEERQRVGDTVRKERVNVDESGRPARDTDYVYEDEPALAGAGADRAESQRGWDQGDKYSPTGWSRTAGDAVETDEDAPDDPKL